MSDENSNKVPAYLKRRPTLFVRSGDDILDAPAEDVAVAERYPRWRHKGPVTDGARLTILTEKDAYHTGEEVRVIHVAEVTDPGRQVYIMGPKPVYDEYVDGKLATKSLPRDQADDPLVPLDYDGPTLPGPAVDYNYDITTYTFSQLGTHTIQWRPGELRSNSLKIEVVE
jgi:hypothetical protein